MGNVRLISGLALLFAALVGGCFLSSYLVTLSLGVRAGATVWNLWWQYWKAATLTAYAPYVFRIKLSGVIGFGVPLLAWFGALVMLCRSKTESLHGEASFASLRDLRKAGLLKRTASSLLIGKFRGRYLWLGGAQHVITVSPTRSGKTTSIAIPVLLTYGHSVVVLDVKGELFKATSGLRQSLGHRIRVWAPYDEAGNTHRFNPMTLLAGMAPGKRIGEIQTIAAILYPDEAGKDPFWTAQSRVTFTALTSYLFEVWDYRISALRENGASATLMPDINTSPAFPSFERVLRFSSGSNGAGTQAMIQSILTQPDHAFVSTPTRTAFSNLAGLAEQTFSSVIATTQAPLQQFLNPILAAATNATDIDVAGLRRKPTSLYVIIPAQKLDESSKLLNIFFSSVIGNNLTKQLGEEAGLDYQMLMLMDEFTAMGRMDVWAKRISISASYGVRDLCIVQSRAQLRSTYGDNDAQNFITNHGAQIVFAPREQSDANEYSEMLGYKTVRRKQESRSRGGGTHQVSTSFSEERRALFLPQEIKELPGDDEFIFYEGCKPIRATKNWCFKDKRFAKLMKIVPAVVNRERHALRQGVRVDTTDLSQRKIEQGH